MIKYKSTDDKEYSKIMLQDIMDCLDRGVNDWEKVKSGISVDEQGYGACKKNAR